MVTVARGGESAFVVPDPAECLVELRTTPDQTGAAALDEVAALLEPDVATPTPSWSRPATAGGSTRRAAADLAARLGAALGTAATFDAPYWMEAPLWQEVCPTLVCGPSGGGLHAVDEWVDLGQVRELRRPRWSTVLRDWAPACRLTRAACAATRRCSTPGCASRSGRRHRSPSPGHKQRTDLVGDVVAGDVPLYAGLDTMKLTARRARRRRGAGGPAVGCGRLPLLHRRRHPRQPGRRPRARRRRRPGRGQPDPAPLAAARPRARRTRAGVGAARGGPRHGPAARRRAGDRRRALDAHPDAAGRARRRPVLRRHRRRHRRARRGGPRARRAARRRRGLGRALRLPPRPAPARPPARRRRHGDQRPQDPAGLEPGRAGAGPDRAGRRRPPGRRRRGDRDDEPGRRDPGQHRRRPRAARARRRGAARRRHRGDPRGPRPARRRRRARRARRPGVDPLKLTLAARRHRRRRQRRRAGPARRPACRSRSADRDVLVAVVSMADTAETLDASPTPSPPRSSATAARRGRSSARRSTASIRSPSSAPRRRSSPRTRPCPLDRRGRAGQRRARRAVPARHPRARARARRSPPTRSRALDQARAAGVRIAYAADPTLATLRVVR